MDKACFTTPCYLLKTWNYISLGTANDLDFCMVPRDLSPNFSELMELLLNKLSTPKYLMPTEHSQGEGDLAGACSVL